MQPTSGPGMNVPPSAGSAENAKPGQGTASSDPALIATAAVRGVAHIATLPDITVNIIEIVENPSSSAQDLNKVISNDPALSARILKVVNSAFYGLPRQIGSINRAISLLGLNAVKNLAIAASLAKLFKGGSLGARFDAKDLWAHSVAVAAISRHIAGSLRLSFTDESFLAGLIHDIGIMVELQAERGKLAIVVQKMEFDTKGNPTTDYLAVEREILGCDHGHYGTALCETWKFPKSFAVVCGHHHDPRAVAPELRTMAWIVHIADRLATEAQKRGFRLDLLSTEIAKEAIDAVGMSGEALQQVRNALPTLLEGADTQFQAAA